MSYLWPLLAFVGFLDSTYLAIKHLTGGDVLCTTSGCETVLSSKYSLLLGIPVSYIGVVYYVAVLILALLFLQNHNKLFLRLGLMAVSIGFVFSGYFVFLQLAVIHSICWYCMGSAATTTVLFLTLLPLNLRPPSDKTTLT